MAFVTGGGGAVRLRITKTLDPREFEEYNVSHFQVGQVYDVTPRLANLLVIGGYAELEMRVTDRAADRAADRPPRKQR
jgi:hypothetical protein